MKDKTHYDLRYKIEGYDWESFMIYVNRDDPDIPKYAKLLKKQKHCEDVELIEVKTIYNKINLQECE